MWGAVDEIIHAKLLASHMINPQQMSGVICLCLKTDDFHILLVLNYNEIHHCCKAFELYKSAWSSKVSQILCPFSPSLPYLCSPNKMDSLGSKLASSSSGSGQACLRLLICTMGIILKTTSKRYYDLGIVPGTEPAFDKCWLLSFKWKKKKNA